MTLPTQLSLRLTIPASPEVAACPEVHRGVQCSHELDHASRGRLWCYAQGLGVLQVWRREGGRVVCWGSDASGGAVTPPLAVENIRSERR